jgi:hypothetical protein
MKTNFLLFLVCTLPLLCKDIVIDSFAGQSLNPSWKIMKGKWEIKEGVLTGSELSDDKHNAVVRRPLGIKDGRIAVSIRLDGAKAAHVSINEKGGHLFRLILTPATVTLQLDKPNANSSTKPRVLGKAALDATPGSWHSVVIEMSGTKVSVVVDGKIHLEGEDDRLKADKFDFGFPVSGVSASYDDLTITSK